MTQTDIINKINEHSPANVYRFPSWHQRKPVQSSQQTGTEPVQPPAAQPKEPPEGDILHPGTVPVLCTGNRAPCTGNSGSATREEEPQPFENAAHTLEREPKVPEVPVSETYNNLQTSTLASRIAVLGNSPSPPPYPGSPLGAPFRPGHQVWLYRWDDQTPRFDAPVTIVQMRSLWPGEHDIGWRNAAGDVTWHNARLAVAVEPQVVAS